MTRVAHILGDLEYGGLQLRVLSMIRALPDYSHGVVFNAIRGAVHDEFAAHCTMIPCRAPGGRVLGGLAYIPRLTRALRAFDPDVVVAHLFGNHLVVAVASALARVPDTWGVSANDPVHFAGSRWQPMLLAHLARPFCRGEIAVSEHVGSVLRDRLGLPADRVHVIPNGCDVEAIARRAAAGRTARLATGAWRLVMAARVSRAKDHETPIRAVALLRERGVDVCIDFAGGAQRRDRRDALETLAAGLGVRESVRFLGPRDDVPELMGGSDVVVHSTHSEGFALTLLEAFAARTPVVASDIPSCREALDGGRCGVLVPPRDAAALADALVALTSDDGRRRSMVDAAWERVNDRYDVRTMAAAYASLIRNGRHFAPSMARL